MLTALDGEADAMLREDGQNGVAQGEGSLHGGVLADALTHHFGGGAADHQQLTCGEVSRLDHLAQGEGGVFRNGFIDNLLHGYSF